MSLPQLHTLHRRLNRVARIIEAIKRLYRCQTYLETEAALIQLRITQDQ